MNFNLWFPTVVATHNVSDTTRIQTKEKVNKWIADGKSTDYCVPSPGENLSTSYHIHSTFIQDCDLHELEAEILNCAKQFIYSMGIGIEDKYRIDSWINFFGPNQSENQHTHYGNFLSGCYYVEAEPNCGNFVFPDATAERDMWRGQYIRDKFESNVLNMNSGSYAAEPGKMLMFQSWMPHSVEKNRTDSTRISIAFNVNPYA